MKKVLFVFACLLTMSSLASAGIYTWDSVTGMYNSGNQIQGTAVTYDAIQAESNLWGTMQTVGDNMYFFPTAFQAGIVQDGATQAIDETLQFTLGLKPGGAENRIIDSITFAEAGHYTLSGTGTDLTNALVTCGVIFTILEIDGVAPALPIIINDALTFTSDGDYKLLEDGSATLANWSGSMVHNFATDLDMFGNPIGNVTLVNVSINNWLEVHSENGTTALIEKKVAAETPAVSITPTIPEPATLALLGLGGLLLRRKK